MHARVMIAGRVDAGAPSSSLSAHRTHPHTPQTHPHTPHNNKNAQKIGITKLSDANEAGTRNSERCTLILTEGDSAKSLALAGLSVVGHDHFGVFPLR